MRWSDDELLKDENNAIGAIAQIDKVASVTNASFQLTAGTKQLLPADAVALIRPVRNMGTDGLTPGREIKSISEEDLTAWRPGWNADPASKTIRHYMADPRDPRRWYNWPPSDGTNYAEIQYAQVPDDLSIELSQATAVSAPNTSTITVANAYGIKVGQMVQDLTTYFVRPPNQPTYPIPPGTTVTAVVPTTGVVTLSAPLVAQVTNTDWISFSDPFPLPDLYAEPVFNFMMAHALAKNSTKGDPSLWQTYWSTFMMLLGADTATIDKLGIGKPDA